MAKVTDITEKLNFEENPKIKINKMELEVNADAPTILKIMGMADKIESDPQTLVKVYELLFTEEARKKIDKLKIGFEDFRTLIESAMNLVVGETEGE